MARNTGAQYVAAYDQEVGLKHAGMYLLDARAGSLRGPANTATCDPDVRVHHHFPGI